MSCKKGRIILLLLIFCISACATRMPERGGVYHIVKKDETLWRIARAYNCNEKELLKINGISDATKIEAGTVLFIPDADKAIKIRTSAVTEKPIIGQKETEAEKSYTVKSEKKEIETGKETMAAESFGTNFIWPVTGEISSKFGRQSEIITLSNGIKINSTRYNNGIIIDAQEGTPVVASENGVIDKTGTFKYYGKTIIINHGRGYMTVYSYLKEIMVKEGEKIKQGETIGLVGKHERDNNNKFSLHFEIRHKNRAKNPLFYLPKSKQ